MVDLKPGQWQRNSSGASPFPYKAFGMSKPMDLASHSKPNFQAGSLFGQKLSQPSEEDE